MDLWIQKMCQELIARQGFSLTCVTWPTVTGKVWLYTILDDGFDEDSNNQRDDPKNLDWSVK